MLSDSEVNAKLKQISQMKELSRQIKGELERKASSKPQLRVKTAWNYLKGLSLENREEIFS